MIRLRYVLASYSVVNAFFQDEDEVVADGDVGLGGEVCDNLDLCSQLLTFSVFRMISMTLPPPRS